MSKKDDDDFDKDLADADEKISQKLGSKLSLSGDVLKAICPSPADRKALDALMKAVNGAASEAEAKAHLIQHAQDYGLVLIRPIKTVALA